VHNRLNPDYPPPDTLAWAAQEAVELQQSFPKLVSLVKPADLPNVEKLFNESDVQVLHFSGHGDVNLNNSDLNKVLLENNRIIADRINCTLFNRLKMNKICGTIEKIYCRFINFGVIFSHKWRLAYDYDAAGRCGFLVGCSRRSVEKGEPNPD
jgi:hypothetical protein